MFAVGNILNRAHNYFQDFWKRFSILIKAQQLQLNRKNRNKSKKEREPTWALPVLAQPTWLGPADWPCQSSSFSRQKDEECVAGARGHTPATSCFCRRPGDVQGCHADPHVPLSSSLTLPLVSLTLSRDGRARSSPPFAVDVTRATPSPL